MKTLLVSSCLLAITILLHAQPGTVDMSFGTNGVSYFNEPYIHNAVIVQPNGKLITAGQYNNTSNFNVKGSVARFLPNGGIDSSFGKNGFVNYPLSSQANDLILQKSKTILVVGETTVDDEQRAYVACLTLKGTLDSTFGTNGVTLIPDYYDWSHYDHIKLKVDGSIIISGAGTKNVYSVNDGYMILSHLSANGIFDTVFGKNGRVQQRFPNYIGVEEKALAMQKDGKILLGGYVLNGGIQDQKLVLCRYYSYGVLDSTFGGTGTVITQGVAGENGENDLAGIIVQPDKKIVIGGTAGGTHQAGFMAALRFNANGALDNTFGTAGRALVHFDNVYADATAILLQPDGKFVLTGNVTINSLQERDVALCRITSNGSIDSSFGINGKQTSDFSDFDFPTCATLQKDGKIVLGGSYYNDKDDFDSYALIRYHGYSATQAVESVSSNAKLFKNAVKNAFSTLLFPNPANSYFIVNGLALNNKTTIAITDISGKTMASYNTSGASQYKCDVSKLTAGVYYLQINSAGKTETLKFIKE